MGKAQCERTYYNCRSTQVLFGLLLFLIFRGITVTPNFVQSILEPLGLFNTGNKKVENFSGGMKRRLSFAISCMGDWKVLFLDEPTTGMDPINRRKVWSMIQELKKDRIVILTTHSMEEADAIGDNILIMHDGFIFFKFLLIIIGILKANGSSMFLKHHYGNGYQITVSSRDESVLDQIQDAIDLLLPESTLSIVSATTRVIAVPAYVIRKLAPFLKALKAIVGTEWNLSNTTLEQVFLALSKQQKQIVDESNESGMYFSGGLKVCVLCKKELSESVPIYTHKGTELTLENVICGVCAETRDRPARIVDPAGSSKQIEISNINENDSINKKIEPLEYKTNKTYLSSVLTVANKNFSYERKKKKMVHIILQLYLFILEHLPGCDFTYFIEHNFWNCCVYC